MTDAEILKAKEILKSFFWQPAEGHNYRFKHATCSRVLYHESVPMEADALQVVTEYLQQLEDVKELIIAGKKHSYKLGWDTKDVWWQTVPGEKFQGTDSTKVRIYWALVQVQSGEADGPYVVEKGCRYKVTHYFEWDVTELPTLEESESGVEYTMQSVTRDRETGLFSCVIEKRERVQQDLASYRQAATIFETVDHEQHLGVKAANLEKTGLAAGAGDGKVVRRDLTKNDDCTANVDNHTTTEVAVSSAVKEYRKTLRALVTTTTNRNQVTALGDTNLKVGETRRSEKTEGGRFNTSTSSVTGVAAGTISAACSKTTTVHTDTTLTNQSSMPTSVEVTAEANKQVRRTARRTEENTVDVEEETTTWTPKSTGDMVSGSSVVKTVSRSKINQTEVPNPGVGGVNVVNSVSASPNDHGSFTTSEQTTTYTPKTTGTMTAGSSVVTTSTKSTINAVEVPNPGPGEANQVKSVSASPNDHGSFTVTEQTTAYRMVEATAKGGSSVVATATRVAINAGAVTGAAGGTNVVKDVSLSPNDHGSFSVTERTTTYTPKTATTSGGTTLVTVTSETGVNQEEVPTETAEANKVVNISASPNDHGSYSTQKQVTTYKATKKTKSWSDDSNDYTLVVYRNQQEPQTANSSEGAVTAQFTMNDHGTYDGNYMVRKPKTVTTTTTTFRYHKSASITSKIMYVKNSELYQRTVTATLDIYYGSLSSVVDAVKDGERCPPAGMVSGYTMVGSNMASGKKYTDIKVQGESKVGS